MNNDLSLILAALEETLESPQAGPQWTQGVRMVEEHRPGANGHVWWITETNCVLSTTDLWTLRGKQLLTNNGASESKKFGGKTRKAYGVLVRKLKQAAQEMELALAGVQVEQGKVRDLQRQLKLHREKINESEQLERFLQGLRESFKIRPTPATPPKFPRPKKTSEKTNAGVPTLLCSDWHVGEVVSLDRVGFLNEYNEAIAKQRIARTFDTTLDVLLRHQAGMSYEGIVISLAGDMFSGNIHDELRATNERLVQESLVDMTETLANHIVRVASEFPAVYVPAVSGNHGKADPRSGAKLGAIDNYDYLLYKMVELMVNAKLGSKCNVTFNIARGPDLTYQLYSTKYLLTHGNQSNTSTNSDNFWPTMMKMAAQRQERMRGAHPSSRAFDYMTVGHFHQYGTVNNVIVNGSLKGHCEWAHLNGFAFQAPIQALWLTHPEYGITSHIPIYGENPSEGRRNDAPPITTFDDLYRK